MKQLTIPKEILIEIDFSDDKIPVSVNVFKPSLFQEGNSFCCLLGPDLQEGVFACGPTKEAALKMWDEELQERLQNPHENDSVVQYLQEIRKTTVEKID